MKEPRHYHLRATAAEEVERRELLKNANGIGGAQDVDGAGEADLLCARCCRCKDHGGHRNEVLGAMVLADAKADLICEGDLFDDALHAIESCNGFTDDGAVRHSNKAVTSDLHPSLSWWRDARIGSSDAAVSTGGHAISPSRAPCPAQKLCSRKIWMRARHLCRSQSALLRLKSMSNESSNLSFSANE
jgi:hypothetical protein